ARRAAVKRALDIILHLQARLRMDVGGSPAKALSEFYAATFAQILQGSQSASRARLEHAIACVRNVRDAWREVARDSAVANGAPQRAQRPGKELSGAGSQNWSA
ncbi:MAG TPA: flagellar protein FliS, partial [Terracidiphilus sp.]|nr:flagellar protein FliS [Terracidiphilus sp.]